MVKTIANQVYFPGKSQHMGDIDFAVPLDLRGFTELERWLIVDGWVRR